MSCYNVGTKSGQLEETSALSSAQSGTTGKCGRIRMGQRIQLQFLVFTAVCPLISALSTIDWLHLQIRGRKWWWLFTVLCAVWILSACLNFHRKSGLQRVERLELHLCVTLSTFSQSFWCCFSGPCHPWAFQCLSWCSAGYFSAVPLTAHHPSSLQVAEAERVHC